MTLYTLNEIHHLLNCLPPQETPFLLLDTERLRQNARQFQAAFPDAQVYFSVKANNHPQVLSLFADEGINFDVASWGEVQLLAALKIPPERIIFSAPTKIPRHIEWAYQFGIRAFAFDSRLEIEKLARLAPGAQVIARIAVDNEGSYWPLERKFGLQPEQAVEYMLLAASHGLKPLGLTFHVGSQNRDPHAWVRALERSHNIWQTLKSRGITLELINTGGGYPAQFDLPVPAISEIAAAILSAAHRLFGEQVRLLVEPGRGLVGNAGIMVTSVINRAQRGDQAWLYLDVGTFHGLIEGIEMFNFQYNVIVERSAEKQIPFILSGPTCDSADIIRSGIHLPEDMTLGDRVFLFPAGAYSNSLERYNGMDYPPVLLTSPTTARGVHSPADQSP